MHDLDAVCKRTWQGFVFVILSLLIFLNGCDLIKRSTPLPEGETIAEIQGAGHVSPYENRPVYNVHGVVTALRADGFYLQSVLPDDDPATSEGVFAYTRTVPRVKIGDEVLLNAVVDEMTPGVTASGVLSVTQLRNPYVEVLSTDNELPPPTIIGEGGRIPPQEIIDDDSLGFVDQGGIFDPENDGLDFYESLEGMRVQVNNPVVVGATNQYKEIVILGDMGANASVRTPRGGIVIRENDFNPERIILDDSLRQMPFVQTGDYAAQPIIGVMDYTFGNYKLQATENVHFESGGLLPEGALSPSQPNHLRVASYNLMNLSARDTQRLAVLGSQIVNLMMSPDIIGLQEIQDNDGSVSTLAVSADETYQGIIDVIAGLGGPPYGFVDIDPIPDRDGGIPAGNIRVGFLYRLDRGLTLADAPHGDANTAVEIINLDGNPSLSLNPGRINPTHLAFADSRKPLVVEFNDAGESLFVINNHFNSKGGDTPLFGEVQPPLLESEIQRNQQAQLVGDFAADLLGLNPNSRVIVLGDLNDFQFSQPLKTLEGDHLINLINTLPIEARYSYVYDGNSQVLDHILVSDSLVEGLVSMDILHVNSEFDYTQRFSDHDILIATFDFD